MTAINNDGVEMPSNSSDNKYELTYLQTVFYGIGIGTAGGLVATIYYFVLEKLLDVVWETGKEFWLPLFPALQLSYLNYT